MASEGLIVDFEPRHEVITEIRASGDLGLPAGWLEVEALRMPFTLRVHGADLIPETLDWWQPLLYMARVATWFVRNLRPGDSEFLQFAMGGGVWMKRDGDDVVLSPLQPVGQVKTVKVGYADLLAAWEDCSDRIRDYLARELPEIVGNPDLAPWFRGEEG